MEGFLFKKGRGESNSMFSKKNWKQRWFVLDGGFATYYETFDQPGNIPKNKKGVVAIVGCTVEKVAHDKRKFVFVLNHQSRKPVYLSAESENLFEVWIEAFQKAATGMMGPSTIDFQPFFDTLELDSSQRFSITDLNKTFRKKALKAHPDKGGSIEEFRKIQDAFDMLVSKLEDEEAAAKFTDVIYECHVRKGELGVGFGMVVVEQPKTGYIVIKSVMPKMQLLYLSAAASGKMLENDRLMTIDEDDVSNWALARVVQRLSDFRVPPGSTVVLKFSRKILKDVETISDQLEEFPEDFQRETQLSVPGFDTNGHTSNLACGSGSYDESALSISTKIPSFQNIESSAAVDTEKQVAFSKSRQLNSSSDIPALESENELLRRQIQEVESFLTNSEVAQTLLANYALLDELNNENAGLRNEIDKLLEIKKANGHYRIDEDVEEESMDTLVEVVNMVKSNSLPEMSIPEISKLKESYRIAITASLCATSKWSHKNFHDRNLKSIDDTVSNLKALEKALASLESSNEDVAGINGGKKPLFRHRQSVLSK